MLFATFQATVSNAYTVIVAVSLLLKISVLYAKPIEVASVLILLRRLGTPKKAKYVYKVYLQ